MRTVFGPQDVEIMRSALQRASARFRYHYGFDGSSLEAAQMIAASAILDHAERNDLETDELTEAAAESVRLLLRQSRQMLSLPQLSARIRRLS